MPGYVPQTVDRLAAQQGPARGAGVGQIVMGKVLRAGTKASTTDAAYYDIIALDNDFAATDLSATITFDNGGRPVYPMLANVAAPAGLSLPADTIVAVRCFAARMVPGPYYETLSGTYDVCAVLSGNATLMSVGGGSSVVDWGVLTD